MTQSLRFLSATAHKEFPGFVAKYELTHSNPGRGGTQLSLVVEMDLRPGCFKASIPDLQPQVKSDNPEEALDKLAEWLERAAVALRKRGTAKPLLNQYEQ